MDKPLEKEIKGTVPITLKTDRNPTPYLPIFLRFVNISHKEESEMAYDSSTTFDESWIDLSASQSRGLRTASLYAMNAGP